MNVKLVDCVSIKIGYESHVMLLWEQGFMLYVKLGKGQPVNKKKAEM